MGNKQSMNKINFEDVQYLQKHNKNLLIISTLPENQQTCLIKGTIDPINEVKVINKLIGKEDITIVVYGKNCNDLTIYEKYNQLKDLGFINIYIYPGGLFEWSLLQDIYGDDLFQTTSKIQDILKYKPPSLINNNTNRYLLTK